MSKDGGSYNTLKENLSSINKDLKHFFDSDDPIRMAFGYHGFGRSGGKRGSRQKPAWVGNVSVIRKILRRSFPKLDTDPRQRRQAAYWVQIIYLYWGRGLSQGKIALELGMTPKAVNHKIDHIYKAAQGRSCNGSGIYRRRGRPKKNRGVTPASSSGTEGSHETC